MSLAFPKPFRALACAFALLGTALTAGDKVPFPEVTDTRDAILGDNEGALRNWTMTCGDLTVQVDEGRAAYIMVAGKPAGLYVKGTGSFRFLVKDPSMKPTVLFNLAENTRLKPKEEGANLVLGEPLTEAIFWFAGRELPKLEMGGRNTLGQDYAGTAGTFVQRDQVPWIAAPEVLRRLPVEHLMAYRALNGSNGTLVTAEIVGAAERYVYTYDGVYSRTESMFIQRPLLDRGWVRSIVLGENPIGWTRNAPPDPDFRLSHIALDLKATRGSFATMDLTESIQVIRPGARCLAFHFTNAKQMVDRLGRDTTEPVVIRHIQREDGKDLNFNARGGFILVDLGRTYKNGENLKLRFEIDGPILDDESEGEFNYWRLQPGTHWLPEPETAGQGYTVDATIAVEKPYVAIASARTVSRTETPTHNVVKVTMDKPITWFAVAAGKYKSLDLVRNNRTVRAWCYGGVPSTAEQLLKTAHGILDFYDALLGGVPFDEINLVEVPYLGFGQAPAGMIWLTREAFNPTADLEARYVAGYGAVGGWANRMIAHELAHQYWGNRVKIYGNGDNWLSEAFAEYSSSLAIKAMKKKGPGVYDNIVADWGVRAAKVASKGTIPTTQYMQPRFSDKGGDPESAGYRQTILYTKGAYLLACLHRELGDDAFFRFLRLYQKRFAWYPPSISQDVPDMLKAITGRDFGPWMADNFWGTGMPALPK